MKLKLKVGNWRVSLLGTSLLLFVFTSFAQKNTKDFVKSPNEGWYVSIEDAYEASNKSNKPILANFTGSDWCGWCKKLKAEVFSQPAFIKWASENVILLELDFPKRTQFPEAQAQQNQELQRAFQVTGFPTIWVFDLKKPEGDKQFQIVPYGKTGYIQGGESAFIQNVKSMLDVKKQAN